MSIAPPLQEVVDAVEADTTRVTRRVEIYESDGVTLWEKPGDVSRLIDGSITVDYTRDERRAVDLTLDNTDGLLAHDPEDGLWYDKVIKVFRGINYDVSTRQPKILIVYDELTRMRSELRNLGYTVVFTNQTASQLSDLQGYDIIVADAYRGQPPAGTMTLLQQAYNAGYQIWTCGNDMDEGELPFVTASIAKNAGIAWQLNLPNYDTVLAGNWGSFTGVSTDAGRLATSLATTATGVAQMTTGGVTGFTAIINRNTDGTRWFHIQLDERETNTRQLIKNSIRWLYGQSSTKSYETQVGQFLIDNIQEDYFPKQTKVTGRDYTKKLLLSRIGNALTFTSGTALGQIITSVAANAQIFNLKLETGNLVITADVSFEKNTTRWEIIKTLCDAYQFEIFFDMFGALTVRAFRDPVTSPTYLEIEAGRNLIKYTKSSNDSRIFNHITVIGDNQDQIAAGVLIFGEALNNEPSSPTRISRLGDRLDPVTSSVLPDSAAALALAKTRLSVAALESFDLSWETFVYPWIEAGDILEFGDPRRAVEEPDRFLMDTFTLPLSLGSMTGSAKRVTIVGEPSAPGDLFTFDTETDIPA